MDLYVISFLSASLLFSGANVYALAYPVLKIFVFIAYFFLVVNFPFFSRGIKNNSIALTSVVLIFIWFFFGLISSIFSANDDTLKLGLRFGTYLMVLVVLFLIDSKVCALFFRLYCNMLYLITLVSLCSYLLNILNVTTMKPLVSSDGREYFTTFFNVMISDSKTTIGNMTFYRFQSIFEEPGTFAFVVLPALYWFQFVEKSKARMFVLLFSILCSLSIGAFVTIFINTFMYYFFVKPHRVIPLAIFVAFVVVCSQAYAPEFMDFLEYKAGAGKYSGQHTSLGAREDEVGFVTDMLSTRTLGFGFSAQNIYSEYSSNVSVGLFRLVLYSGLVGGAAIVILNLLLLFYSIACLAKNSDLLSFVGSGLFAFLMMGLQRSTFLEGFMAITVFSMLIKCSSAELVCESR